MRYVHNLCCLGGLKTHDGRNVLLFYKEPLQTEIPGLNTSFQNSPEKESPYTPEKPKSEKAGRRGPSSLNTSQQSIMVRDLLDPVDRVESSQFALLLPASVERGDFEQQINSVQMDLDEPYLS